jgi:hypothetical protein
LISGRRYLFKESDRKYPDQFWTEVVAYRVGCLLGIDVPPSFAAYNSASGNTCGSLTQWFYVDGVERFVWAGELLQNIRPGFDRKLGTDHNLKDIRSLVLSLRINGVLAPGEDWRLWWATALLFDALIGNTDRHQDNWGLLYRQRAGGGLDEAVLAPYFDNGTSLGHELWPDLVADWSDQRVAQYTNRGKPHVRLEHGAPREQHEVLLQKVMKRWPHVRSSLSERLAQCSEAALRGVLEDLLTLDMPLMLSRSRFDLMLRLLCARLERLQGLF